MDLSSLLEAVEDIQNENSLNLLKRILAAHLENGDEDDEQVDRKEQEAEQEAKKLFERTYGAAKNFCWSEPSWKALLGCKNAGVGFDVKSAVHEGFSFVAEKDTNEIYKVKLDKGGPKLLVSDVSSKEQPIMRWRLRVKGNTAVEFGVVLTDFQDKNTALHHCIKETDGAFAVGFASRATAGSQLPFQCTVVKGAIVEFGINNGKVDFLILNPSDGLDSHWDGDNRVQAQYRGPEEIRFSKKYPASFNVKLALTAWATAEFDVLNKTCRG